MQAAREHGNRKKGEVGQAAFGAVAQFRRSLGAAAILAAVVCGTAVAATPRETGDVTDSIIAYVDYDESKVVTIVAYLGYSRAITFSEGENVVTIAMGDSQAFEVAPKGNHVFIKPAAENARTNMQVLTSKNRLYSFFLEGAVRRPGPNAASAELFRRVVFRYPAEAAAAAAPDPVEVARQELAATEREIRNLDYHACGSSAVTPDNAFDDGRFTYLRYAGSRPMPAVFVVNPDGTEALVDSHVEDDTIVVHRVAERFVFRRGESVGCVVNKSFDPRGIETFNGTVDDQVFRIVKGRPE